MTALEIVLAVVGAGVTVMVVVGMFLIVPSGVERAPLHTARPVGPPADPIPPETVPDEALARR